VAIAHNKLIIIDGKTVIGGSYNFTISAEGRNAENVTFIDSQDVAKLYLSNWEARKAVSRIYIPPSSFDVGRAPALASANTGQR
jgi:phospholipase D